MGDLFYTGQRRQSSAAFSIDMKDGRELAKRLKKIEDNGETAIKRTVSDFSSRAPAWVSKGIREHYGVDTAAIKDAGPKKTNGGKSASVAGKTIEGAALLYEGRTLTPIHFKMSPKSQPTARQKKYRRVPGAAIAGAGDVAMIYPPKKYKVKATIIKGQRVSLPPGTFIAEVNGGNNLPFQRTGGGRGPIEAVRTLSVPQMIEGRAKDTIQESIGENLSKRLEHHMKQAMK